MRARPPGDSPRRRTDRRRAPMMPCLLLARIIKPLRPWPKHLQSTLASPRAHSCFGAALAERGGSPAVRGCREKLARCLAGGGARALLLTGRGNWRLADGCRLAPCLNSARETSGLDIAPRGACAESSHALLRGTRKRRCAKSKCARALGTCCLRAFGGRRLVLLLLQWIALIGGNCTS